MENKDNAKIPIAFVNRYESDFKLIDNQNVTSFFAEM
jgi:hypothetical protein